MKFHSIGCSTIIAIGIGLILTMFVFLATVAAMKAGGGVSAAKLVLLVAGIISLVIAIYCGWQYNNTVVEIKYRWWEFLCTIFSIVTFGCAAIYFGDVLDKGESKSENQAIHAEP